MDSKQNSKIESLERPILKLNLGADKVLPETVLNKINKLKSHEQRLNIQSTAKLLKKKGALKEELALKVPNTEEVREKVEIREVKKDKKDKEESNISEPTDSRQTAKTRKWLLKPQLYDKMLSEFKADFPNCFTESKRPLALNIRQALIEAKPEYPPMQIAKFLKIYCRRAGYKNKLELGAGRVNLDGEVSSLVTEEQLAKDKSNIPAKRSSDCAT